MTTTEVAVAALTDLAVGEGRAFDVDGRQVAVFRLRDGRVVALDAACPHRARFHLDPGLVRLAEAAGDRIEEEARSRLRGPGRA